MLVQRSRTYYRSTAKAYSTRSLSQSYRVSLLVEIVARSTNMTTTTHSQALVTSHTASCVIRICNIVRVLSRIRPALVNNYSHIHFGLPITQTGTKDQQPMSQKASRIVRDGYFLSVIRLMPALG